MSVGSPAVGVLESELSDSVGMIHESRGLSQLAGKRGECGIRGLSCSFIEEGARDNGMISMFDHTPCK